MALKRARRQAAGDREHHRGDPAGIAELVQLPEIQHQPGRDAEIDEVGEAVELRPELGLALDHARDAAVDAVQRGGEHDGVDGERHPPLDRQPDRRQAGADRQQRDDVGHQHPHRNRAEPPAANVRVFDVIGRHGSSSP
ncbi:hypothetical protein ABIF41_002175 [Bradyrhizobium japonicum]